MRLLQYTKGKLRILFDHKAPFRTKSKIDGKRLIISLHPVKPPSSQAKKKDPPPPPAPTLNQTIVIDPGHGGRDSGAVGYKRKREKDIVLAIAKRLYEELKRRGYRVYMTRRGDYFVPLRNRTRLANRMKAHLFISIHANAAPSKRKYLSMKGIETFFLSPSKSERAKRVAELENRVDTRNMSYFSKQVYLDFLNREKTILSNKLAIDIQRGILYNLRQRYRGVVDGGVRPGPFWVLVGAQMPAVLIEVGYITNPTEAMRLANPLYQKLLAKGIADGIGNYFIHNQK
ncbi:MAG: N-acetylmuramoyl-L-alanine amidase [Nitratiruptor sp.]|nr:N-acetylmuramoyl-L-alanine amidase [Nitratiruptor sp.]NPA84164.1 N-acetylmuramoyl-L-alanine amidase [Campylobacterota bacterium]